MKNRTLVMVTHHIELVLPACAWVVLLSDGEIEDQGTVEDLRSRGSLEAASSHSLSLEKEAAPVQEGGNPVSGDVPNENDLKPVQQLVEEEKKATGSVKFEVYRRYLKASSYTAMTIVVFLLILFKMSDLLEKFWISFWTRSYDSPTSIRLFSTSLSGSSVPLFPHFLWNDPVTLFYSPSTILKSSPTLSTFSSGFFSFPSASDNVLPYVLMLLFIELIGAFIWVTLGELNSEGWSANSRLIVGTYLPSPCTLRLEKSYHRLLGLLSRWKSLVRFDVDCGR